MNSDTGFVVDCICSSVAVLILLIRSAGTAYLLRGLDHTGALVGLSILVLTARAVVSGFYDVYGTASQVLAGHDPASLTAEQLQKIKIGTILNLVARILVTSFYWLQIALLLLFYSKLFRDLEKSWNRVITCTWFVFGVTYTACILATFLECRPFYLYWQINPPPGNCVKAYRQLYIQGISNIILDVLILIISYRVLTIKHNTQAHRFRIGFIYCLGLVCIIITSVRLAITKSFNSSIAIRSIWASVQAMVSAAVANLPTIYGNMTLYQRKKSVAQEQRNIRAGSYADLRDPPSDTFDQKTSFPLQHIEDAGNEG